MLFDALFLVLFFAAWCALGVLAWIPLSLRRGSVGALFALPFALAGGAGGGAAVPLLGLDTGVGVGASMAAALAGGVLLCAAAYRVWDGFDLGERFAGWARRAGGRAGGTVAAGGTRARTGKAGGRWRRARRG